MNKSKKEKNSFYEDYPYDPKDDHPTMIRPHVFGAKNKFGEIDDNGSLRKIEGKYRHVRGEVATLRVSAYWGLINAILRELRMTNRDRFILEAHSEGKTARKINSMLAESDYFKPYKKSGYVNDRIQSLIRRYFLTPKSELNAIF